MTHRKMAQDCWRLIKAIMETDEIYTTDVRKWLSVEMTNVDAAATHLIEMACDSAAEAERGRGYPTDAATQRPWFHHHPAGSVRVCDGQHGTEEGCRTIVEAEILGRTREEAVANAALVVKAVNALNTET